ncbi:MAG: hypothetical protein P0116_02415 [Candidatus Nitrosocosmicus sp.]|nr:hypothetical protein [Candidatus Nitrosocosmicus sp.]
MFLGLISIQLNLLNERINVNSILTHERYIYLISSSIESLKTSILQLIQLGLDQSLFSSVIDEFTNGKNNVSALSARFREIVVRRKIEDPSNSLELDLYWKIYLENMILMYEWIVSYSIHKDMKDFLIDSIPRRILDLVLISHLSSQVTVLTRAFNLLFQISFYMNKISNELQLGYDRSFLRVIEEYSLHLIRTVSDSKNNDVK